MSLLQHKMIKACKTNDFNELQLLLRQNGNPNTRASYNDDMSLLMISAKRRYFHICKLLVDNGAHVNAKDTHGMTALIYATAAGSMEIASYLLSNGADPNATSNSDVNALYYAVKNRDTNIWKLLRKMVLN